MIYCIRYLSVNLTITSKVCFPRLNVTFQGSVLHLAFQHSGTKDATVGGVAHTGLLPPALSFPPLCSGSSGFIAVCQALFQRSPELCWQRQEFASSGNWSECKKQDARGGLSPYQSYHPPS